MTNGLVVLLVDDSPYDRAMVRRELRKEFAGAQVIEVTNADEFAAALEESVFQLVITDFQIRWTDGLKVLHAVRRRRPDCPVLMFTATGGEETAVEAMKAGLDDYIIKNLKHMVRLCGAVRAALEHKATQTRAQQLETRLGTLLTQLRVGVFRRTADGKIVEANDAMAGILNVESAAALIGMNLSQFIQFSESGTATQRTAGGIVAEKSATRADGSSVWISISETPVIDDHGLSLFEGLLEDISARKLAESELMTLQDELADADRVNIIAEMAAGISHQLSQPLTVITSLAEISREKLHESSPPISDIIRWLQQIHDYGLEAGQVVRGLHHFVEHRPRNPVHTDISQLIRSSIEMQSFELRRIQIETKITLEESLPELNIDPIQIRQVLMNVIRFQMNGLRHSESDERKIDIHASVKSRHLSICISDNGPYLPADQLQNLFEPYVSHRNRTTSMGMSIASRIIRAHNGSITAQNNCPSGTTIEVSLPIESDG